MIGNFALMPVMPVSVIDYAGLSWRPMICHIPSVCYTFSVAGITVAGWCSSEIRRASGVFSRQRSTSEGQARYAGTDKLDNTLSIGV